MRPKFGDTNAETSPHATLRGIKTTKLPQTTEVARNLRRIFQQENYPFARRRARVFSKFSPPRVRGALENSDFFWPVQQKQASQAAKSRISHCKTWFFYGKQTYSSM